MPVLLVLLLVVPLAELWVILQVGQQIGPMSTIVLLLAVSAAGAALLKREGLRAWGRFRSALAAGRIPAEEVVDGALVLFAGALLLTPGFLTDVLGLVLIVPPTRAVVNRVLRKRVLRAFGLAGGRPSRLVRGRPGAAEGNRTVDVEVVRVERSPDAGGSREL